MKKASDRAACDAACVANGKCKFAVLVKEKCTLHKEAKNRPKIPLLEKFHRGNPRGVRNISDTL